MSVKPKKVVIIGGGIIGLSSAYYAAKKGFEVIVLERSSEDEEGCSFGNAGLVVPSHIVPLAAPGMISKGLRWLLNPESPFYIKPTLSWELLRWGMLFWKHAKQSHTDANKDLLATLNLESRELFTDLAKDENFGLETKGLLMLCQTQEALREEAAVARMAQELGMDIEICSVERLKELDPDIDMNVCGGVHFQQDCHLDPKRLIKALRARTLALGGKIQYKAAVQDFEFRDGSIQSATLENNTRIEGDEFVLASGSWSPSLGKTARLNFPLQAGKGYSLTLENPPQLPRLSSILVEAKVAVTPIGKSLRVSGTMEVGTRETNINPSRVRGIVKSFASYFPKYKAEDFENVEPWAGLRPCSPDGLPYIGKSPFHDNLTVATGHAMMGLSLGPVTGTLVANLLAKDGEPDPRLSPARFMK